MDHGNLKSPFWDPPVPIGAPHERCMKIEIIDTILQLPLRTKCYLSGSPCVFDEVYAGPARRLAILLLQGDCHAKC